MDAHVFTINTKNPGLTIGLIKKGSHLETDFFTQNSYMVPEVLPVYTFIGVKQHLNKIQFTTNYTNFYNTGFVRKQ